MSLSEFFGVLSSEFCAVFIGKTTQNLSLHDKIWFFCRFDTGSEVKNDAHSELEFVKLQA